MNILQFERIQQSVGYLFSPIACTCCDSQVVHSGAPLCTLCLEKFYLSKARQVNFTILNSGRCIKCGRPLISEHELCTTCRNTPFLNAIDRIIPLFPYTSLGQELLTSWKIKGCRGLSRIFSLCYATALEKSDFMIIPVPPRPGKIREKGWDQMEEIACFLETDFQIKVNRILKRQHSFQQKKLGRLERKLNLKGKISVLPDVIIPKTAILIDDLMTTGSTLDACAEALKCAGTLKVYGLTLFHD